VTKVMDEGRVTELGPCAGGFATDVICSVAVAVLVKGRGRDSVVTGVICTTGPGLLVTTVVDGGLVTELGP
jgi:hypothetical protein